MLFWEALADACYLDAGEVGCWAHGADPAGYFEAGWGEDLGIVRSLYGGRGGEGYLADDGGGGPVGCASVLEAAVWVHMLFSEFISYFLV